MVRDIKIIYENEQEIKPENNLVVLPYKNKREFITYEEAKQIIRLLQSQINCIEVKRIDRKTGLTEHKKHNNGQKISST